MEEKMQFNKLSDIWNDLGERSTAVMNLHINMYWKNVVLAFASQPTIDHLLYPIPTLKVPEEQITKREKNV